ncbi:MAG: hypothetical protein K0S53_1454 [Bacteroidetes bacterium]|jgi:hypothetical protein|nr:hypothetical protein [Bacteroidota bacterium]
MKKLFTTVFIFLIFFSALTFGQSNVTWKLKDKGEKGFFKTKTVFHSAFYGFNNKTESNALIAKLKTDPAVASILASNVDSRGNCDMVITMKQVQGKLYYVTLAQRLHVAYMEFNNQKKTPSQILSDIRSRKK